MKKILSIVLTLIILCASSPLCAVNVAAETTPTVVVEGSVGAAGDTVSVNILLANNPGIVFMQLKVAYDADVLELIDYIGDGNNDCMHYGPSTNNPFLVTWTDPLNPDNTKDGIFATLTFKIKNNVSEGTTPITVTYDQENVFNSAYEDVCFDVQNGFIEIISCSHENTTITTENEKQLTCVQDASYEKITTCNACGNEIFREIIVTVKAPGHILDADNVCTTCGEPVYAEPTIYLNNSCGNAGDEVTVDILLANNPGFNSMKLLVEYDSDVLELVDRTHGDTFGKMVYSQTLDANPYILNWVDSFNPYKLSSGTFATLTFKIKEGATIGESEITVTYNPDDVYNSDWENVTFAVKNGTVTVEPCSHDSTTPSIDNEVSATCTDDGCYEKVIVCNKCSEELSRDVIIISAFGHSIDKNGLCANCGETFEVPMVVVSQTRGKTGTDVTITVSTLNNPGIVSMLLWLGYDSDALELISINEAKFGGVQFGPLTANPIAINWVDGLCDNNTTDGDVAILTFKVKEDAIEGVYPITLTYDPEDVFDYNLKDIYFDVQNGAVEVYYCDHVSYETVQENNVSATCIYDGGYDNVGYCTECNEEIFRNHVTVKASGHLFSEVAKVPADCYSTGIAAHKLCNICNKKYPSGADVMASDTQALSNDELTIPFAHLANAGGKCTICGNYVFTKPTFAVSHVGGNAGGTVNVTVSTVNNPGIVSFKLLIYYNTDALELISFKRGEFSGLATNNVSNTPFILNWVDAISPDNTTDGNIATLTFKIKDNAALGEHPITVMYNADDVYNSVWDNVDFDVHNGAIEVLKCDHTNTYATRENVIDATCTEAGSYEEVVYCTDCGCELSRDIYTVNSFGHTEGDSLEYNCFEPTCTKAGYYTMVVYCTTCNEKLSEYVITIPARGHSDTYDMAENGTEATCTTDGIYDCVSRCIECDTELSRETIIVKTTGHVYDNDDDAECNNCDFVRVLYTPGDVNDDGAINNRDLAVLMQYLGCWDVQINEKAADVNRDCRINNKDYALLMQYHNGWDVELG